MNISQKGTKTRVVKVYSSLQVLIINGFIMFVNQTQKHADLKVPFAVPSHIYKLQILEHTGQQLELQLHYLINIIFLINIYSYWSKTWLHLFCCVFKIHYNEYIIINVHIIFEMVLFWLVYSVTPFFLIIISVLWAHFSEITLSGCNNIEGSL